MVVLIALTTFISTIIGGLVALKLKDKLHLVLGFSAGAVIGVAFFDLIPESIELGSKYFDIDAVMTMTAIGFAAYLILDRLILLHGHDHGHGEEDSLRADQRRGTLGAGSLAVHSLFDGIAIGLAFQVSAAIGGIVAIAVLVHDFSDGINTVGLILKNKGEKRFAFKWLVVVALAPVVGAISTLFFSLSEKSLSIVLALFSGFFLYIGASDLIPESHHGHPKLLTTIMTILGALVLFLAIQLAH